MTVCNCGRRIRVPVLLAAVGALLASGPAGAADRPKAILRGHKSQVLAAAFSPDARTLASVSEDRMTRVWDLATGKARTTLKGDRVGLTAVAFSPDGKTLAGVRPDGTIRLWQVTTGKELASLKEGEGPLAFSPDGKTLACRSKD